VTHCAYAAELRGIDKIYPGSETKANDNITLGLCRGEIFCIAGENGSGKTTLMKILDGLEAPNAGEIYINGNAVTIDSPLAAQRLGIGMVHQHFMLFPEYTVAENIVMGMEPRKWGIFTDSAKANAEAAKVIEAHQFSIDPKRPVHSLGIGEMQQVEICRLLYRNASIIILDEPSSVLTEHEAASLFKTLKALAAAGKSIFLITHKLHEIKSAAGRVGVLRRGELKGIYKTDEIDEFELARLITGNESWAQSPAKKPFCGRRTAGKPIIAFDKVTLLRQGQQRPLLQDVSFTVKAGEIVGFAGVGGNGLGALEAILGGFLHPSKGKITHNGKDISGHNIRRLRSQGLAYVPADRQRVGSAMNAAINENAIINRRQEFSRIGFIDKKKVNNYSQKLIQRYNIASAKLTGPAGALSGGNLQKLILAREIGQLRDYIVFSEPTWGLDITASDFVRAEITALREKGAAVILISTNLDEILFLAGRIIVMYRGCAIAEFDNCGNSIKQKISYCMQGLLPDGTVYK
jgi:simple sugar transport system ATP-binding protein